MHDVVRKAATVSHPMLAEQLVRQDPQLPLLRCWMAPAELQLHPSAPQPQLVTQNPLPQAHTLHDLMLFCRCCSTHPAVM